MVYVFYFCVSVVQHHYCLSSFEIRSSYVGTRQWTDVHGICIFTFECRSYKTITAYEICSAIPEEHQVGLFLVVF